MFIINRERFNLETVKTKYSEIETEFEHLNIFFDSYHWR